MTKKELIDELTLFDAQCFRKIERMKRGMYQQEHSDFRLNLSEIYNKLSKNDIKQILKTRKSNEQDK